MTDVPRTVRQVTDARAIEQAMDEYDALGRDTFLSLYGYGRSRKYYIRHRGRLYDSKPIIGVAFAYQHKGLAPLCFDDFSGGEATVEPQLVSLEFSVVRKGLLAKRERERLATKPGNDDAPSNSADARTRILASIARRLGQPKFRRELLRAYSERCAISGEPALAVLEAAHIEPYRVRGLNTVTNGLLLRADLHTLFDLGLISFDEHDRLLVAAVLDNSDYANLRGKPLRVPDVTAYRPSKQALAAHRSAGKAG